MAAFFGDTVCAFQLPLVRDGGAAADLHLYLPQDALPLPPRPPDRVRLHTRFFLKSQRTLLRYTGYGPISGCGNNNVQPV